MNVSLFYIIEQNSYLEDIYQLREIIYFVLCNSSGMHILLQTVRQ